MIHHERACQLLQRLTPANRTPAQFDHDAGVIEQVIREAVNAKLEEAAKIADLGLPSRDWSAQAERDPEAVEAAVGRDIATGIRALKEAGPAEGG